MESVSRNSKGPSENVPKDDELITREILKIRDKIKLYNKRIGQYEKQLNTESQSTEQTEIHKTTLEKETLELEHDLKAETCERNLIKNQISEMRKLIKKVDAINQSDMEILQGADNDLQAIISLSTEQNNLVKENLTDMSMYIKKYDIQEDKMNHYFIQQREMLQQNEFIIDEESSALKKNITNKELELKKHCDLIQEDTEKNENLLNEIKEEEKERSVIKNDLSRSEQYRDELDVEIKKELEEFHIKKVQLLNDLENKKECKLKKETAVDTLKRAQAIQTDHMEDLRKKIKIKKDHTVTLSERIKHLQKSNNEIKKEMEEEEDRLVKEINAKAEEIKTMQVTKNNETQNVANIENEIFALTQKHADLIRVIEGEELKVQQLTVSKEEQAKNLKNSEEDCLTLSSQYQNLSREESEAKRALRNSEWEDIEFKKKLTDLNLLVADKDKLIANEQEIKISTIQEMNRIKLEYDMKTFQHTKDFEETTKSITNELELLQKELRDKSLAQIEKDEELERLTGTCVTMVDEIKRNEEINSFFASLTEPKNTELVQTPLDQTKSRDVLPPSTPKKHSVFGELSDSSAEGQVVTASQIRLHQQLRKRRRLIREQRREAKEAKRFRSTIS